VTITFVDNTEPVALPTEDVLLLHHDRFGNRMDLGARGNKDIRIIIEQPGVRALVSELLPQAKKPPHGSDWKSAAKISGLLIGLILISVVVVLQLERIVPALIPDETIRGFGADLADGYVELLGGHCRSVEGDLALQKLVARLNKHGPNGLPLKVRVVNHELVNAFALPGGQIIVFDGLIQEAASADEVAGVLAHEIGHEKHEHALKGLTRSLGMGVLGAIFGGSQMAEISKQLVMFGHSRSMEEEADKAAIQILRNAEVSARPLAGFFDRIASQENRITDFGLGELSSFLSTHPDSADRAIAMKKAGGKTDPAILHAAEWAALTSMCETLQEEAE